MMNESFLTVRPVLVRAGLEGEVRTEQSLVETKNSGLESLAFEPFVAGETLAAEDAFPLVAVSSWVCIMPMLESVY